MNFTFPMAEIASLAKVSEFGQFFGGLWPLLIVVAAAMAVRLVLIHRPRTMTSTSAAEFRALPSLFEPDELHFLESLQKVLPEGYVAVGNVRLSDLVKPPVADRSTAGYHKFSSAEADFVLCEEKTYKVHAVIELDDASDHRADSQERERVFNNVLRSAGIPVLRIPSRPVYDPAKLRPLVMNVLPEV